MNHSAPKAIIFKSLKSMQARKSKIKHGSKKWHHLPGPILLKRRRPKRCNHFFFSDYVMTYWLLLIFKEHHLSEWIAWGLKNSEVPLCFWWQLWINYYFLSPPRCVQISTEETQKLYYSLLLTDVRISVLSLMQPTTQPWNGNFICGWVRS